MRICRGVPRELYPADGFDDERWESFNDGEVFKRLKRIDASDGVLSADSVAKIDLISQKHPRWVASSGDRDDFQVWHGGVVTGPRGDPELLTAIADDHLVQEAMRLQEEQYFAERDLWSVFCQADPDRALRGLQARAQTGDWDKEAWEGLLWAAHQKGGAQFQHELADTLLQAPRVAVKPFLAATVAWLQQRREALSNPDQAGGPRYFKLWDKLADLAYSAAENEDPQQSDHDLLSISWSDPGGKLAWTLWEKLYSSEPKPGCGLGPEFRPRLDRAVDARGKPGLLARVALSQRLDYLDRVDAAWTAEKLVPRFAWTDPDAAALWHARAYDGIGSPELFNALKRAFLQIFPRRDLSRQQLEGLVGHLLQAALWHRQNDGGGYNLTSAEAKRALSIGPPQVRHWASSQLWRWAARGLPLERAEHWLALFGPLFRDIWPLDAHLRDEESSRNLVLMALAVDASFSDAVDAIANLIVPYKALVSG